MIKFSILTNESAASKLPVVMSALLIIVASSILAYDFVDKQQVKDLNIKIQSLENNIISLQKSISDLQKGRTYAGSPTVNTSIVNLDPVAIYNQDYQSVVTIKATKVSTINSRFGPLTSTQEILGSGFVIDYNNSLYVVTNFHVIDGAVNNTVTFWNGNAYRANVLGSDPYADLAVVSTEAPRSEFYPLAITSSAFLQVGQSVMVIGNPFGLSGSMTLGVISQMERTLQEQTTGSFPIADVIQFSAPINPGNSGGPLLNAQGEVIGITTAVVGGSQGVGFAIPSDTVIRELPFLVSTGKYDRHPYLGVGLIDLDYQLAQVVKSNVTYGVLVESIVKDGPADKAHLKASDNIVRIGNQQYLIGGDIIVSINGTRIVNQDVISSYLEKHTLAGQVIHVGVIRDEKYIQVQVILGKGPGLQGTI